MTIKAYFDTEFTGLHKDTTLISIGIVYDSDHMFYAELTDYDKRQIDEWLQENVINSLTLGDMGENTYKFGNDMKIKYVKGTKEFVGKELNFWHEYLYHNEQVQFWSDCLSYDWVLFNDMYGHAFSIPNNVYYIPFDICTQFEMADVDPDIQREMFAEGFINTEGLEVSEDKHNALWDAIVIKACHEKLKYM
ncbi:3'-5' exoribonuclease domain-containing protein [Bacillus atrophaeus]|uniref:3'-5' exoribonuclease domain-containing protein n=1 Tax=Bacillus atrophaeus TaxID=1452 RepID=UPI002E1D2C95|nr:3'-5' exoribonuclease [Bacillus atrophaeus]